MLIAVRLDKFCSKGTNFPELNSVVAIIFLKDPDFITKYLGTGQLPQ
jgi:hypothetical protein